MENQFSNMIIQVPLANYVLLGSILFVIGILGVLIRRNAFIMLVSIQIIFCSVILLMVAFSSYSTDPNPKAFTIFIIIVALVQTSIGVMIMTLFRKHFGSIDLSKLDKLRSEI